jgi:carbamoyl-phosphate synthase small subunit
MKSDFKSVKKNTAAILVLADGAIFKGESIGALGCHVGEVVFNTSMTGYQEILTDPSYAEQMVTLTYPHIGNTGVNVEDIESNGIHARGLIIREASPVVSNWRATGSLEQYLQENDVVGIAGVDTRRLTRHLRDHGAQAGCIMAGEVDEAKALEKAKSFPGLNGMDLAKTVTCEAPYEWGAASKSAGCHVVVYDFGVKFQILRMLKARGCKVSVVPANYPLAKVLAMAPDGVMLSNGPGDPSACTYAIETARALVEQAMPTFGICLGFQILALAMDASTIKMKFGHHGANHPVKDEDAEKVCITSQNHGFCVDEKTVPDSCRVTHRSLFDGSLQGFVHVSKPIFGFQGHPEASPGPQDIAYLFDQFVTNMQGSVVE